MNELTRARVRHELLALLTGEKTRSEVADWSSSIIRQERSGAHDPVVRDALSALASADLKTAPDTYLYHENDFHKWLDEVEGADDSAI